MDTQVQTQMCSQGLMTPPGVTANWREASKGSKDVR